MGGDSSAWTWAISVLLSILSGAMTAGYVIGATRKDIQQLKRMVEESSMDRNELRREMREEIHQLLNMILSGRHIP